MTKENMLIDAITNNELEKFLIGEPPYFFGSGSSNDEPQNISQAFDILVYPYWIRVQKESFLFQLRESFISILNNHSDRNRSIYVAHNWIWYYFYCLNKKRANPSGFYKNLFEIDFNEVASPLKIIIEKKQTGLDFG